MIRRQAACEYQLITQHDHALLAGHLAGHLGNTLCERPEPFDDVVLAIALHDCGWPTHDDHPTLDADGRPTDVFESPLAVSLTAWSASVQRAMAHGPYVALLVSLHALFLSSLLAAPDSSARVRPLSRTPRELFELNKFQHRQVEIHETLRRQLHMNVDQPLTLGLANDDHDPRERALRRNLRILQAMDLMSLALCRTHPPAHQAPAFCLRAGLPAARLSWQSQGDDLLVDPWPFDRATITATVPYRAVPLGAYADEPAFHRDLASCQPRQRPLVIRPA